MSIHIEGELGALATTAALLFSVPAATYINDVKTLLSWKSISISLKLTIIILTIISCGFFLLLAVIYYFVARNNPKSLIGLLRITAGELEPQVDNEQQKLPTTSSKSIIIQQGDQRQTLSPLPPGATVAPSIPDGTTPEPQTLADYATLFAADAYFTGFIVRHGDLKPSLKARRLSKNDAENWGFYFGTSTTVWRDGTTATEKCTHADSLLEGINYFLDIHKAGTGDDTTLRRLEALAFCYDRLEAGFRVAPPDVLDSILFGEPSYPFPEKYKSHTDDVMALQSANPAKLLEEFHSLDSEVEIKTSTITFRGRYRLMIRDEPTAALDAVIGRRIFTDVVNANKSLAELYYLYCIIAADNIAVGFGGLLDLDANGLPDLVFHGNNSTPAKLERDGIVSKIDEHCCRVCNGHVDALMSAITTKWPDSPTLGSYAQLFDEGSAVAKFIGENPNLPFYDNPDDDCQCTIDYLAVYYLNARQFFRTDNFLVFVTKLLKEYETSKTNGANLLLTFALIPLKEHGAHLRDIIGDACYAMFNPRCASAQDHIAAAIGFLFGDGEGSPKWNGELQRLRINDPMAFIVKVNDALGKGELESIVENVDNQKIRIIIERSRQHKEMCGSCAAYKALYELRFAGCCPIVAASIHMEQRIESAFPKYFYKTGKVCEFDSKSVEGYLLKLINGCDFNRQKGNIAIVLAAAKTRWPEHDFQKCDQLLATK
ncbi:MAG: hypothetical protein LBB38_03160 [Puniceicoccales bacterium]|jgi:hypothetical protein|nr:hypothetical protein [Puniceicoccales bacterium]